MYKIMSFEVGNTPEKERADYDKAEKILNDFEKEGWLVIQLCWDDGGLQGRAASGIVVILNKKIK